MDVMTVLIVACAIGVLFTAVQSALLWNFLSQTPLIANSDDLNRFKRVARIGMYLTIMAMPVMLVMIVSSVIIGATQGLGGLGRVILLNAIVLIIARLGSTLEVRARSLSTESEELESDYQEIGKVWVEKVFPNF